MNQHSQEYLTATATISILINRLAGKSLLHRHNVLISTTNVTQSRIAHHDRHLRLNSPDLIVNNHRLNSLSTRWLIRRGSPSLYSTVSIWSKPNSADVSRPNISTLTFNFIFSWSTSVTLPVKSANGPAITLTLSPTLTSISC